MDPLLKRLGFDAHNKKYIFFETNFQQLLEQKKNWHQHFSVAQQSQRNWTTKKLVNSTSPKVKHIFSNIVAWFEKLSARQNIIESDKVCLAQTMASLVVGLKRRKGHWAEWPDWAIFKGSGHTYSYKSSPNTWFFGQLLENLGYILFHHLVKLQLCHSHHFRRGKAMDSM